VKLTTRMFKHKKFLILLAESKAESEVIDKVLGDCEAGDLAVQGVVTTSDDFQEHYIRLQRVPGVPVRSHDRPKPRKQSRQAAEALIF
jgi:hypothetical protein